MYNRFSEIVEESNRELVSICFVNILSKARHFVSKHLDREIPHIVWAKKLEIIGAKIDEDNTWVICSITQNFSSEEDIFKETKFTKEGKDVAILESLLSKSTHSLLKRSLFNEYDIKEFDILTHKLLVYEDRM